VVVATAAYMGGLALGSHFGGKFADRLRRPVAAYGLLEIGIALVGLVVPAVCRLIPLVDEHLFADLESGTGRALVRFVVAALVLALPTTAMGMTLPVLARAVATKASDVGREVGTLYALNLAGAVAGAALTGFVLVPSFGLATTNAVAVGIDLVLGIAALSFGMRLAPLAAAAPSDDSPVLRQGTGALVTVLAVTGASAMGLQVLWTRALGTALGPSTYAFSAIVCAYLIGLALGGGLAARLSEGVREVRVALAWVLVGTAFAVLFGIVLVDDLPALLHRVVLNPELTMGGLVQTEFGLAALSLLPATIGMGALFPLTLSAVVGSENHLGAAVGRAYATNTVGNIFGCFAGVFILLPLFGVEWGMRVAALGYVGVAALLVVRLDAATAPRVRHGLIAGVTLAGIALVAWPSWDVGRWTVGLYRLSMARTYFPSAGEIETAKVVYHADGLATTVTVEEESGVRWIKVNGKIDGSSHGDMPTQTLSGLLPMLVHPSPKDVAVIGCGTCVTVGAALDANPESLTLIELEPKVVDAAHEFFAAQNGSPRDDRRVTVVADDGRNYLRRTPRSFDVIISEPSNPWMTGASSLFTAEFFTIAEARMKPGAMFLQWLQAYELAPERIASVLKTFHSVFPHVLVFSAHPDSNDLLLLGSNEPFSLGRERLETRFDEVRRQLDRAELRDVDDLLALLLCSSDQFDRLPDVPLNTDDNALIEFGAPKDLLTFAETDPHLALFSEMDGKRQKLVRDLGGVGGGATETLGLAWAYVRQGMLADGRATVNDLLARQEVSPALTTAAIEVSEVAVLLEDETEHEALLDHVRGEKSGRFVEAATLAKEDELAGIKKLEEGEAPWSTNERLLYVYLSFKAEEYSDARRELRLLHKDPTASHAHSAVQYFLARAAYGDGSYSKAADEMREYRRARQAAMSVARQPN
jgi:spermidine synthase